MSHLSELKQPGFSVSDGQLMIEDLSAAEIAARAGTPVYVYSQSALEEMLAAYVRSFSDDDLHCRVIYASKAFNTLAMLQLAARAGAGADVVSMGELLTALASGMPAADIVFHGNNKSKAEIEKALEAKIGCIVCDNLDEAKRIAKAAEKYPDSGCSVLLRVNPGVEAHTHSYIVTAHVDSKFGIGKDDLETILAIARTIDQAPGLSFDGFHAHIGSQIMDLNAFVSEIQVMAAFMEAFEKAGGRPVRTLDLGGGFAARYTSDDTPAEIDETARVLIETVKAACREHHLSLENLWIEPGRSITANAGLTLYTLSGIKKTPHKTWVFADGGMNDNIRPALYSAQYTCDLANRIDEECTETVSVAGKCCESGDILVPECTLPLPEEGDLLAVYTTGAYGYAMASHYNKLPVPGVLFVKGDQMQWVVEPEEPQDLMARERKLNLS